MEQVWAVVPDESREERRASIAANTRRDLTERLRKIPVEESRNRVAPLVKDSVQK